MRVLWRERSNPVAWWWALLTAISGVNVAHAVHPSIAKCICARGEYSLRRAASERRDGLV